MPNSCLLITSVLSAGKTASRWCRWAGASPRWRTVRSPTSACLSTSPRVSNAYWWGADSISCTCTSRSLRLSVSRPYAKHGVPVIATFHSTPVGLLGYELGHRLLGRFYERLEGRVVTSARAAPVLRDFFGGEYRAVPAGTRLVRFADGLTATSPGRGLYVYRGDDRRGLRAFLRALAAAFPSDLESVVVALHRPSADRWPPRPAPRRLRSRVTWVDFDDTLELQPLYDAAALVFLPYLGGEWLLPAVSEAVVTGRSAVAPDLPVVRDLLGLVTGTRFFDPALEQSLASSWRTFGISPCDRRRRRVSSTRCRASPTPSSDSTRR